LRSTYVKRPDLLEDRLLTEEDRRLLDEVVQEESTRRSMVCGGKES
jgi:hypothetical protein